MRVPFVDLHAQYLSIKSEIDTAVKNVIEETAFIGGSYVDKFETEFAALYGVKHCIGVANGTDSLYIIMKMLGIGAGDEVITVANSWISSSETISQTGAKPIFIDVEADYFTIDPIKLEQAITKNTKAIIPVHLQGQMCDMDAVMRISKAHGIPVIEDCAQSHFSEYKGVRAGLSGVAGSFSFYPGKNLGAYGDAGCIITNDDALAEKCRMYSHHGALKKHQHQIEGINSRLDGIQAAILRAKLPHILNWTEARINNAKHYADLLKDIPEIKTPKTRPETKHSFHLYVILAEKRDELATFLKSNNIETAIHYPSILPLLPAYKYLELTFDQFPISYGQSSQILSLPLYPELNLERMECVASKIKEFYNR
jgi:dTDP-4-amino-4,6-dideoxygalactose transaminase